MWSSICAKSKTVSNGANSHRGWFAETVCLGIPLPRAKVNMAASFCWRRTTAWQISETLFFRSKHQATKSSSLVVMAEVLEQSLSLINGCIASSWKCSWRRIRTCLRKLCQCTRKGGVWSDIPDVRFVMVASLIDQSLTNVAITTGLQE